MMDKKTYVLELLGILEEKRPIAKWLKILIEGNTSDNEMIDGLIEILTKMAEGHQDSEIKEKLEKSKDILEKLKKIERDQHLKDQKELDALDQMIKEL